MIYILETCATPTVQPNALQLGLNGNQVSVFVAQQNLWEQTVDSGDRHEFGHVYWYLGEGHFETIQQQCKERYLQAFQEGPF